MAAALVSSLLKAMVDALLKYEGRVDRFLGDGVLAVFRKWGLQAVVIGEVTGDGMLTILDGDEVVARVSAELLTTPPQYDMPAAEPAYLARTAAFDASRLPAFDRLAQQKSPSQQSLHSFASKLSRADADYVTRISAN